MCLLLLAHDCCPGYRFIVAANRDEYHARPSAPATYWEDAPTILAGRDLEGGGTWLGLHVAGRFATVTNVRAGFAVPRGVRSRGLIVTDFLQSGASAASFAAALAAQPHDYDGFNLLAYDGDAWCWYSNQARAPRTLAPGIHTLSNADLDTSWPKTERLRAGFASIMASPTSDPAGALLALLRDARRADDGLLPDTGIGRDMESVLSSIFIEGAAYGTRCSTVVLVADDASAFFHERRYDAQARVIGDSRFEFELARAVT